MIVSAQINRPDWLAGFQQLLPALQELTAADITIADDGLTLRGVVTSDNERSAIVQQMVSGGIDPGRLNISAYGESRPAAENTTTEGRARNRRVELKIIE